MYDVALYLKLNELDKTCFVNVSKSI